MKSLDKKEFMALAFHLLGTGQFHTFNDAVAYIKRLYRKSKTDGFWYMRGERVVRRVVDKTLKLNRRTGDRRKGDRRAA